MVTCSKNKGGFRKLNFNSAPLWILDSNIIHCKLGQILNSGFFQCLPTTLQTIVFNFSPINLRIKTALFLEALQTEGKHVDKNQRNHNSPCLDNLHACCYMGHSKGSPKTSEPQQENVSNCHCLCSLSEGASA